MGRETNAARAQVRFDDEAGEGLRARPGCLTSDLAGAAAAESPARRLQRDLELAHALAAPDVPKWSERRALAFIALSSATLWAVLLGGVRALL